jgi:ribonuclease P protein component
MLPVTFRPKQIEGPSRVTIIVSKKIDSRAVYRNRIKRLIRESVRHLSPTGLGGICIVRKNIAHYSQKEVEIMLGGLLHETNRS